VGEATLLDFTHLRTHEAPSLMLLGCGGTEKSIKPAGVG